MTMTKTQTRKIHARKVERAALRLLDAMPRDDELLYDVLRDCLRCRGFREPIERAMRDHADEAAERKHADLAVS
jgi:hypothetical protein